MKSKSLIKLLLPLMLLFGIMVMANVGADAASNGTCGANLTWVLDDDGTLTISGTGAMRNWTYSSGTPWYNNRTSVKTIIINEGVTSIGDYAFDNCYNLTSVTIPDSVTSIGSDAFSSCSSLSAINADISNKLYSSYDGVLFNKDKSELICCPGGKTGKYSIPGSVTSIGSSAFYKCGKLTSVTIPDSVTSIGRSAFCGCSSLTSVTIPDSVTSIGRSAFSSCSSLTSVTIPDSVTSIGSSAFYKCGKLTSVTIPDSVTSISDYAFSGCSSLTSVTIPDRDYDTIGLNQ